MSRTTSARAAALRLLQYRPRARGELRESLAAKGYSADETNDVLSYLERIGYINDIDFMESWCFFRQQGSPRGRWFVKNELSNKGISQKDLYEYFDSFYPVEKERECIRKIVQKMIDRCSHMEDKCWEKEWRKITLKLCRKGFDRSLVFEALDQLKTNELDIYGKKL